MDSGELTEAWQVAMEVLLLQPYNTRLVVLSTALLGVASGLVGSFLLLRKRALMGDALSHACLPGIGLLFILQVSMGGHGKSLPLLLLGALLTGLLGVAVVAWIRQTTRLKDDAAMGVVLSVFFGLGIVLLGFIQSLPGAAAAGLETFIYGKTASMVAQDFAWITAVAVLVALVSAILYKELTLLCFDEVYARVQGWPVRSLDLGLLLLVALVTVVGLQAVGLILIIAFLIIPAAAARFWTHDLRRMLALAGLIGGASGWLGATVSALLPKTPAGAVIVLTAAALFVVSMIFGRAQGVLIKVYGMWCLRRKEGRQHLLRAIFEIMEGQLRAQGHPLANAPVPLAKLRAHRSWNAGELRRLIRRARREDHLEFVDAQQIRLSEAGFGEAARTTRNHRLWEKFLIEYADIAPSHVDRDADAVEHILGADMVSRLEAKLRETDAVGIPESPHPLSTKPES